MVGRGRPRGLPKSPGTGRQKGTPNKRTVELREELEGFLSKSKRDHPVLLMLKIGHGLVTWPVVVRTRGPNGETINQIAQVPASPELRVQCLKETAQYMAAKLTAIKLIGDDGKSVLPPIIPWGSLASDPHVKEFLAARKGKRPATGSAMSRAPAGQLGEVAPRPNW